MSEERFSALPQACRRGASEAFAGNTRAAQHGALLKHVLPVTPQGLILFPKFEFR